MTYKRVALAALILFSMLPAFSQDYRRVDLYDCPAGRTPLTLVSDFPGGPWKFEDEAKAKDCKFIPLEKAHPAHAKREAAKRAAPADNAVANDIPIWRPSAATTTSTTDGSGAFGWALLLTLALVYFVPYAVASVREAKAANGVLIVNLFLGWTFIGWVVALAWAASGEKRPAAIAPAK